MIFESTYRRQAMAAWDAQRKQPDNSLQLNEQTNLNDVSPALHQTSMDTEPASQPPREKKNILGWLLPRT